VATIDRRWWLGSTALVLLLIAGCGRAPSMGDDREVFHAIDALYSGVSLRDAAQVDRCVKTLDGLKDAGRMPAAAFEAIGRIVQQTRDDQWEPAQSELRKFMLDQRH
jgi:hypothetical protein